MTRKTFEVGYPEFTKVVRYFRLSDYAAWVTGTLFLPLGLFGLEKYEPASGAKFGRPPAVHLRAAGVLGFIGGFLIAYKRSVQRFKGQAENEREVKKDRYEVKKLLSQNMNPYGVSSLTPYLQDVASRNSKDSHMMLGIIPWFNFVNHQNHGIDLKKYYEVREGEEKWGISLSPPRVGEVDPVDQ
ncbi:hypothetical protein OGATHE_003937 [Ogataea polymorpha]|uniref:NADH-ubiquinone oxidoreductase 21 kDa subunit n=1 Tax=Ogataea polymorpha TaxID=460523 RepID=A0A9P8P4I4_9ASCO|nr:hypothetical protein OGATHE_003937 [Ogataea polymorpha]